MIERLTNYDMNDNKLSFELRLFAADVFEATAQLEISTSILWRHNEKDVFTRQVSAHDVHISSPNVVKMSKYFFFVYRSYQTMDRNRINISVIMVYYKFLYIECSIFVDIYSIYAKMITYLITTLISPPTCT